MSGVSSASASAILPYYAQYPAGANPLTDGNGPTASDPQDVVDIQSNLGGVFTAQAGDTFSVSSLFTAAPPSGGSIAGYKVALGDDSGNNGQLLLDGKNVTGQTTFTADEFAQLQYVAGANGSSQSLEVVAQSGTLNKDGSISNEIDSPAVQITASVTGTRSINAANALITQPTGTDANEIAIAQQASIFTGFNGAAQPALTTSGNFTADAGDTFSVSSLFTAAPPSGGSIAGYKVALGDDSGNNGQLLLDGKNVTGQTTFTADEFAQLQYVAGANGSSQSLEVVAQSGTLNKDGSISNEIDSPAVQITASVTGTRSINAANALITQPTGTDANEIAIAQQASIFTGFNGAAQPTLTTSGNFTADAGDTFSVSSLFTAAPPSGGSIAGYKVALGDDSGNNGELLLNGKNVTGQTSFTADQFAQLQYVAGANGSSQSLEVVAQSGTLNKDGSISNEIDSPAVQITASVTGTRSINAANALITQPTGTDANEIAIAQQASIFTGFNGAAQPTLTTSGNFTADAGDTFSVSSLFTAAPPSGGSIAGYKVALGDDSGDNGELLLNGKNVTGQTTFTADEFAQLQYVAGSSGSSESLEVVAQTGTLNKDGSISNEIDSPAVQITASVTGTRSINAANALITQPTGTDANEIAIAQQASIFTGFNGAAQPTLTTGGNFTADAGDTFSVSSLFTAAPPSGGSIAGYKVALGDDSGNNGQLLLDGKNVTGQTTFTADEFAQLQYVAGANGSSQSLEVVAQSGTLNKDGSISNEIDSPAVQITASVTGTRSINAANALITQPTGTDANEIAIAQQASIFTGFNGAAQPKLSSVAIAQLGTVDLDTLSALIGGYQSSLIAAQPAVDLLSGVAGSVGDSTSANGKSSPIRQADQTLLWALSASEIGGDQTAGGGTALQQYSAAAYQQAGGTLSSTA